MCSRVCSLSDPSRVGYRKHVDTRVAPATLNAIGPEVKHIYEASLRLSAYADRIDRFISSSIYSCHGRI